MKVTNAGYEFITPIDGDVILKRIEQAGRTCYKSEDKITDTSCEEFVSRMVNSGHGAMLEHGTVYLNIPCKLDYNDYGDITWIKIKSNSSYEEYGENPYTKVKLVKHGWATEGNIYITTNYRVLVENGWLDDLQYQCEPTEHHEKRITVKFICDRGVSHEFVRHRVKSFAQESTRYCNYIKAKFGGSVTCITPPWLQESEELEFEEIDIENEEYGFYTFEINSEEDIDNDTENILNI